MKVFHVRILGIINESNRIEVYISRINVMAKDIFEAIIEATDRVKPLSCILDIIEETN